MARLDVMLSWSGPVSRQVALALRDWLQKVIQNVQPFMSEEDIPKGAQWLAKLQEALQKAKFGILCLTPDNLHAEWLQFEAGAIWKALPESRVCPLLFRIERATDVRAPLGLFQMTVSATRKDEMLRLVRGINETQEEEEQLKERALEEAFATRWPILEQAFANIHAEEASQPPSTEEMLEEILGTVRTMSQMMAQPQPANTTFAWKPLTGGDLLSSLLNRMYDPEEQRAFNEVMHQREQRRSGSAKKEQGAQEKKKDQQGAQEKKKDPGSSD